MEQSARNAGSLTVQSAPVTELAAQPVKANSVSMEMNAARARATNVPVVPMMLTLVKFALVEFQLMANALIVQKTTVPSALMERKLVHHAEMDMGSSTTNASNARSIPVKTAKMTLQVVPSAKINTFGMAVNARNVLIEDMVTTMMKTTAN